MDSDSSSVFQVPCGHLSGLFIVSGGFPSQWSDLCRRMFSPFHVDSWLWKSCYHSWTLDGHFWWVSEVKVLVAQLFLTLGDPMNCSPPGSSVPGISQARILEWVAISSSRVSSQPRDWTQVSYIAGRWFFYFILFYFIYHLSHQGSSWWMFTSWISSIQSPSQSTPHFQGFLPPQVYFCLHHGLPFWMIYCEIPPSFNPGISLCCLPPRSYSFT